MKLSKALSAVFTLVLLVACDSKATKEKILFKDVPLDKPAVISSLKKLCMEHKNNSESKCSFGEKEKSLMFWVNYGGMYCTQGGADGCLALMELRNDQSLVKVEMFGNKDAMLKLAETLEAKYGKPVKTKTQVQNGLGNNYDQENFIWNDGQGSRITINSIYEKIDEGRVVIESASYIAIQDANEKKAKESNKANL